MLCTVCGKDYSNALRAFNVRSYNRFYINDDVFTAEALQLIFDYAQVNQLESFSINADITKEIKCAGCQELNIEQRRRRRELLNLKEFNYVNNEDFF